MPPPAAAAARSVPAPPCSTCRQTALSLATAVMARLCRLTGSWRTCMPPSGHSSSSNSSSSGSSGGSGASWRHLLQARIRAVSPQSVCRSIARRPSRATSALTTPTAPLSVAANRGVSPAARTQTLCWTWSRHHGIEAPADELLVPTHSQRLRPAPHTCVVGVLGRRPHSQQDLYGGG